MMYIGWETLCRMNLGLLKEPCQRFVKIFTCLICNNQIIRRFSQSSKHFFLLDRSSDSGMHLPYAAARHHACAGAS